MLSNLHTHSTFCDGANTPEEIVLSAINKGFCSIGFSGHGYTDYGTYGIKDTASYIAEINCLKEKYKKDIEIYCGIEEDMFYYLERDDFDFIIGSCHYFEKDGKYFPIDSKPEWFSDYLKNLYDNDVLKLADDYYSKFCKYILKRKPDVVGHFDLITKFDEMGESLFLNNKEYLALSEKYIIEALKSECIFEVNTGAISRGYRKTPYPYENLLFEMKKHGAKIMLNSDSHAADTLDFKFTETKQLLKDIGFTHTYILYKKEFTKINL